jgi:hypothetical protein
MSRVIITIRIPKKLRDKMRMYNINWSDEIRKFIESRIRYYELSRVIDEIRVKAKERRVKVDSEELIREDRESR